MASSLPESRSDTVLVVASRHHDMGDVRGHLEAAGFAPKGFQGAHELLSAALPEAPACIVADIDMVDMDGFELMQRLSALGQPIPVIFVSAGDDVALSVRAIKAGASDFIPIARVATHLAEAVDNALVIDSKVRRIARSQKILHERFDRLTPRERQVMDGVVQGFLNKQIAWRLNISEITVKLHRSSMMKKLEFRSVPDLVMAAIMMNYIDVVDMKV